MVIIIISIFFYIRFQINSWYECFPFLLLNYYYHVFFLYLQLCVLPVLYTVYSFKLNIYIASVLLNAIFYGFLNFLNIVWLLFTGQVQQCRRLLLALARMLTMTIFQCHFVIQVQWWLIDCMTMASRWSIRPKARLNSVIWIRLLDNCEFGWMVVRLGGCNIADVTRTAADCVFCDCFDWSQLKCVSGCDGRWFDWFEIGYANGVLWNCVLFQWCLNIVFVAMNVDAVNVIYVVFGCQFIGQFTQ